MRVVILGAGPAGLYLAYLLKRDRPAIDVEVIEQNPPDATFGFGVVFSDRALDFLEKHDAETLAAIQPHLESWQDITVVHRGEEIAIDGIGFAAVGRLTLLQILQQRARSVGVHPAFHRRVTSLADIDADVLVGADGVNSLVRTSRPEAFGTTIRHLTNRFAWFGTTKRFTTLTQTFRATPRGHFNAHHYRYAPDMSTFIVEVDQATFHGAGLDRMNADASRALCEEVFADTLGGHKLVANNSIWRQFPVVHNERWSHGRAVLIGDALHTAHFSIGSGTRLAMEDAIALAASLAEHGTDIAAGFAAFDARRRPALDKLVGGANASADWYEHFAEHMKLAPIDFAMSYLTRTGRVGLDRLRQFSPRFAAQYERERPVTANA